MDSKKISLIIVLAAVSLVLNPRFSGFTVPSFFPGLWFQFWEIPVIAALLIMDLKSAVLISLLDTAVLWVLYTGPGFNAPLFNFLALISTIIGVYLAPKLLSKTASKEIEIPKRKQMIFSTALGMLFRVLVMVPAVYLGTIFLRPILLGTTVPDAVIIGFLPTIALYDAVVALYTIPLSYLVCNIIIKNLKFDV